MNKRRTGLSALALALVTTLYQPLHTFGQEPVRPSTPDETIEYLVQQGPVSSFVGDELKDLYEKIRDDPSRFVGPISGQLVLPSSATQPINSEQLQRLTAALSLLVLLGEEHGGNLGADFYARVSVLYREAEDAYEHAVARADDEAIVWRHRIMSDFVILRRRAIKTAGAIPSERLVDICLQTLGEEEYGTQLVMLEYLRNMGAAHEEATSTLMTLLHNPDSQLYGDETLKRTLEILTEGKDGQ